MTKSQHRKEAERLLRVADNNAYDLGVEAQKYIVQRAHVHALLAQ